jgi:alpha-tubulin suppressor-like RCC1 family protein
VAGYPTLQPLSVRSVHAIYEGTHLASGLPCTSVSGFTCSLSSAGRLYCWGNNETGQLGDGTRTSRHTAGAVSGIPGNVTSVDVGFDLQIGFNCSSEPGGFACATNDAGSVYCWGDNRGGLLRTGDSLDRLEPEAVVGFPVRVSPEASP